MDHAQLDAPLSARSVALSLLLGARPPRMSGRDLTGLGETFGVSTATMRVALSRMVSAGDLEVEDGTYTLSPRHVQRQRLTEALAHPRLRPYDGMWRMLVVVDRGRSAAERSTLRSELARARYGELREGVWLRPDNLESTLGGDGRVDPEFGSTVESFTTTPSGDRGLTRRLWDLDAWASTAHELLATLDREGPPIVRLTAAASAVRHLCTDPALPEELVPEHWPADRLRWAYEDYRDELSTRYLTDDVPMAGTDKETT